MKTILTGVITLVLVLGLAGVVRADTVELDLFDLGCPAEFNWDTQNWQTDFDLGTGFIKITNVYMDWSGAITAGLAIQLDPVTFEPIGDPFPKMVAIYAYMGRNPGARIVDVWGGEATYPVPEPFEHLSEFELLGPTTWSDLLVGQGSITIGYMELFMLYGFYIEHGSVNLDRAILIVEGVIPEPGTILLLATGIIGMRLKKRRN